MLSVPRINTHKGKTMKTVVYYRTKKNNRADLSQQKAAVAEWSANAKAHTVAEFTEQEGDKKLMNRPKLSEAIAKARDTGSMLVIAKLDRLARNVTFTAALLEGEVEFVCLDNPHANKMTIQMLAGLAENEAMQISKKTKDALAKAKAEGKKLGSARPGHWEGREHLRGSIKGAKMAAKAREDRARTAYEPLVQPLLDLEAKFKADGEGAIYERLAEWLNDNGHRTTRGGLFNPSAAWRIINRYGPKKKKKAVA